MGKKKNKNRGKQLDGGTPVSASPCQTFEQGQCSDQGQESGEVVSQVHAKATVVGSTQGSSLVTAQQPEGGPSEAIFLPPSVTSVDKLDAELLLPKAAEHLVSSENTENRSTSTQAATEPASTASSSKRLRFLRSRYLFYALVTVVLFVSYELKYCYWQSVVFSRLTKDISHQLVKGPSKAALRFDGGPYDRRLGYSLIPEFLPRLVDSGFQIYEQAEVSTRHQELVDRGMYPLYSEKSQAGFSLVDMNNELVAQSKYPESVYEDFSEIPKLISDTLLYIEDRQLLDEDHPRRNPTLDWERLVKAGLDFAKSKVASGHQVPGGSTLATQTEKFRHSPQGITHTPKDKLRQMFSASARAYSHGVDTLAARQNILRNYLNSVPLAALPGYGEVNGLADGLWAYYGQTLADTNSSLSKEFTGRESSEIVEQGRAYRRVLSLFLAHRRPSELLRGDPAPLNAKVDTYLGLLKRDGIIPEPLYQAAIDSTENPRRVLPKFEEPSFLGRKAQNLVRTYLLSVLGMDRLYELDRLDLFAKTTLHNQVQTEVTKQLVSLKDPKAVQSAGLEGFRMLSQQQDLSQIIYSFTLFETDGKTNKLRIQTDNFDQPFNINEGTKLDLGSTAKFRTLVTYLQIVEELFNRYATLEKKELEDARSSSPDNLSRWAIDYILGIRANKTENEPQLRPMLEAAMERKYSASPGEAFFTAGGLHTFSNFNPDDNGRVVTMRQAIRNSINLPFIRLMRDIVFYYQYNITGSTARTLASMEAMSRREYLERFADKEGKVFLRKFYEKYQGKTPEQILDVLLDGVEYKPKRFASVYWVMNPQAQFSEFSEFMTTNFEGRELTEKDLQQLYGIYSSHQFSLGDKGYIARVHPLELWLAAFLYKNPNSGLKEVFDSSASERQEVYGWLFQSKRKAAQNVRIRTMLETEAFVEIHKKWKAVGYPLDSLVPSYATSLGTSADRPSALAELMGIIVNQGRRLPTEKIERLEFASETPFAANLKFVGKEPEQVIHPEIADVVKAALLDVVQNGTAVRLKEGLKFKDGFLPVGGKTGTGDHRHDTYGPGGRVKESRVVNRTATFVFYIGDRFFGTITAIVRGNEAKNFKFTSSLPVQLVKSLGPSLEPLLVGSGVQNVKPAEQGSVAKE